ncbi:unnamed protein product [Rhodiola kirilowii]
MITVMYNRRGQLKQEFKRETRFTSKCPADDIINKITKAAKSLGFDVQTKELQVFMPRFSCWEQLGQRTLH